jgi:hypothetical protein
MNMDARLAILTAVSLIAALAAGCANDGGAIGSSLTTSSVDASQQAKLTAQQAKVDPACIQLSARIDTLRKEGFVERVEKASSGKSQTVQVKRASLAKMSELDKANAEFQTKCSTLPAPAVQAQAPAGTPGPAASTQPAAQTATQATTQAASSTSKQAANTATTAAAKASAPATPAVPAVAPAAPTPPATPPVGSP